MSNNTIILYLPMFKSIFWDPKIILKKRKKETALDLYMDHEYRVWNLYLISITIIVIFAKKKAIG